jgi:ABC-type Fe3+ transport system permease subunit
MNLIMLITLVICFAVIFSLRRARRRPRVTEITRTVTNEKKENGTGA